jgi:hypothetical protein
LWNDLQKGCQAAAARLSFPYGVLKKVEEQKKKQDLNYKHALTITWSTAWAFEKVCKKELVL